MKAYMTSKFSRFSTGMTAFVVSGLLVYSMLQDNGGMVNSQQKWLEANSRAVLIDRNASYLDQIIENNVPHYIDQSVTGSISQPENQKLTRHTQDNDTKEAISVLDLIRDNSDVAPGVSSGTARVSVIVKKGDTLFNISQRHGMSVTDLARLNGLDEPFTIKIGQTLYVAR